MTADKILAIARAEIGVKESPAGSNRQKYGEAYGWNGVPWCMQFVWWCFKQAGASSIFIDGQKSASCGSVMAWAKGDKKWVTKDYKPGDVVIFDFNRDGEQEHVGICESVDKGGNLICIEGNTSVGNDSNGGEVMRRNRALKYVMGAYRPAYKEEEKMAEKDNAPSEWAAEAVKWAQEQGLIKGDQYGDLMLHDNVTREQLCVFLYRLSK